MSRRRLLLLAAALAAVALSVALPGGSFGHPERTAVFPNPAGGKVPAYRSGGPTIVVCKSDSGARVRRIYKGRKLRNARKGRLRMLKRCRFRHIQQAVNAAKSGTRILVMPGVYREEPSRAVPVGAPGQPPCADNYVETEGAHYAPPPAGPSSNDPASRPDRNYQVRCPNSKNLIAVIGDPRPEPDPQHPLLPACTQKCNLQISGFGRTPADVLIVGDRRKLDVIRVDRANGVYLSNFTIEQGAFNDVDVVETDGFRVSKVVARYAQNYGVLTFSSIHGLYDHIDAFGNGDSGVYPGSNAKGCNVDRNAYGMCDQGATAADPRAGCGPTTTELRQVNSHDNVLGYSGTAGNSTWVHDSRFHDNNAGLTTDSFASGHPGMPQECFKWERNQINSNNQNFFTAERQDYCIKTPFAQRKREIVCPQFQVPVGTGVLIAGGNRDLLRANRIYDNWRYGVGLITVPASVRGDNDPGHQQDTSNGNVFDSNVMGAPPGGGRAPNGKDFFWDEAGQQNCWRGNTSQSGADHSSIPASLPGCPGRDTWQPPNLGTYSLLVPCTAWDPMTNPRPIACDWFDTPAKPS